MREATGTATLFPWREGNILSLAWGLPSSHPASRSCTGPVTRTSDMKAQVQEIHQSWGRAVASVTLTPAPLD